MIRLEKLSCPCPVNRRLMPVLVSKGGRRIPMQVLSREYRQKQQRLVSEVWTKLSGRPTPMTGSVQVFVTFTPRDKRTADCDAYAKALLDGLAKAGVYVDDKQVVQCSFERMPVPQFPGWLDVEIHEVPT